MRPELKLYNGKQVLFVDGRPFYAIAGEVHNSDSSSPEYMEKIWNIADELGMNTLLLPVTWEMVEPEEGVFDFTVPDALILQARTWKKRIVFLWFGSWKNAEMMYAPEWVKRDIRRFERAEIVKGEAKSLRKMGSAEVSYYSISYLSRAACEADAKAFGTLMAHIKEIDEAYGTVIGVQVENETGLLGNSRERSDRADRAFAENVPEDFVSYMRSHTETMHPDVKAAVEAGAEKGSWSEVFGPAAEEIFSAYHVAGFVNYVAQKGLEQYPLPTFANCWLVHEGEAPGQYPSGGPVSRMHEVWRYCAPAIDVLCPDIYVPAFVETCDDYSRNQPLFIPEAATHSYAAPRMAYCIGHYHAMGYSPFGFDDIGKPFTVIQGFLFGMDVNDPALKTPQDCEVYAWFGKTLSAMMPVLVEKYGTNDLQAVTSERHQEKNSMEFGKLRITASFRHPYMPLAGNGVVLAAKISDEEYYLLCYQSAVSLEAQDAAHLDILRLEEGCFRDGQWHGGRRLNGDEVAGITVEEPRLFRLKIHTYND